MPNSPRLAAAAAAAVVLHAAVLLMVQFQVAAQSTASAPSLQARVISSPAAMAEPAVPIALSSPADQTPPLRGRPAIGERERAFGVKALTTVTAKPKLAAAAPTPVKPVPPRDAELPSAPQYLSAAQLDPGPVPRQDIEPEYPSEAELQEGTVILRLLINEQGSVDNAAVVRATPSGLFESAAIEAFGSANFSPGMLRGVPVKSQVTIEVRFTPINRGSTVSGRRY